MVVSINILTTDCATNNLFPIVIPLNLNRNSKRISRGVLRGERLHEIQLILKAFE